MLWWNECNKYKELWIDLNLCSSIYENQMIEENERMSEEVNVVLEKFSFFSIDTVHLKRKIRTEREKSEK